MTPLANNYIEADFWKVTGFTRKIWTMLSSPVIFQAHHGHNRIFHDNTLVIITIPS